MSLKVIARWKERPCERGNTVVTLSRKEVSSFSLVPSLLTYFYSAFFPLNFNLPPSLLHWVVRSDKVDVTGLQWNVTSRNLLSELTGTALQQTRLLIKWTALSLVQSTCISFFMFTVSFSLLNLFIHPSAYCLQCLSIATKGTHMLALEWRGCVWKQW